QCCDVGGEGLPWARKGIVGREHRPPDCLADSALADGCDLVLSGDRVYAADTKVEILLAVGLYDDVEPIVAEHLGVLPAAGDDFGYIAELSLRSVRHELGARQAILNIHRGRGL